MHSWRGETLEFEKNPKLEITHEEEETLKLVHGTIKIRKLIGYNIDSCRIFNKIWIIKKVDAFYCLFKILYIFSEKKHLYLAFFGTNFLSLYYSEDLLEEFGDSIYNSKKFAGWKWEKNKSTAVSIKLQVLLICSENLHFFKKFLINLYSNIYL